MNLGFVGLGKLGLPVAVALARRHDVLGYDHDPEQMRPGPRPYRETGPDGVGPFAPHLETSTIRFATLEEVVNQSAILFVTVQTPHDPRHEGVTRLPEDRADFDYTYLAAAMKSVNALIRRPTTVAIVSTVLPGTIEREIRPLLGPHIRLCYHPLFIAMGTTMRDFLNPEFILLGVDDPESADKIARMYATFTDAPVCRMSIESAELTKVAYNTYIGMKLAFANTVMEICHRTPGADVDSVVGALKLGTRRLVSTQYMNGGMGDGGGCHPRDNIAMSWLAQRLDLSHNMFEDIMLARERQTEWLADLLCEHELPKALLGYSFKAESNLTVGSPALLLKTMLEERGITPLMYDPHIDPRRDISKLAPHVFLIGSKHDEFLETTFPRGSVVIDPWRYIPAQAGVTVVPVGVGPKRG